LFLLARLRTIRSTVVLAEFDNSGDVMIASACEFCRDTIVSIAKDICFACHQWIFFAIFWRLVRGEGT
jgi:hypothetical protein